MNDDKIFAAYALTLALGLLAVLGIALSLGIAKPPPAVMFLEHLALGLGVRFAYKSFGGFDWADWSLLGNAPAAAPATLGEAAAEAEADFKAAA